MASITFPIDLAGFWQGLRVSSIQFTLGEAISMAETAGGEILTARRGNRLWSGTAEVTPAKPNDQDQVMALIDLIRQSGASFMVYDHKRRFSQHDPDGSHQGATICTASSVAADRREITLEGLPIGYVLTRGDHVSIAYGASPVRYYLGRVVQGATFAATTPTTVTVELTPTIPPGVTPGDAVSLVRPSCKAVYVPGSLKALTRRPVIDTGFSFQWTQTLR